MEHFNLVVHQAQWREVQPLWNTRAPHQMENIILVFPLVKATMVLFVGLIGVGLMFRIASLLR